MQLSNNVQILPTESSTLPTQRVACLLLRNKVANTPPINDLAEACYRYSPQIAIRGNEAIFLEIGGCRTLYSEDTLLVRLAVLAQRFGCLPYIGFANDPAAALAQARFGIGTIAKLPLEALHDYADPFELSERKSETFKKTSELIKTLHKLGLNNLTDFVRLPSRNLASRFGAGAVQLHERVQQSIAGGLTLPWPRFTPPEKISEQIELHDSAEVGPCLSLEPLLFVIRGLADRAVARLRGRGQRAATIELELEFEAYNGLKVRKRSWTIELPVPQGSVSGLMPILRVRLGFDFDRQPLPAPIIGVNFTVTETTPGHRLQRDFFDSRDAEAEAWDSLVGRLCQKLGKERAFHAAPIDRHLPEKAWKRRLEIVTRGKAAALSIGTSTPTRPARVLHKPVFLRKDGEYLIQFTDGRQPARRWRVTDWHGPERISCEWWSDPEFRGFNRDYFKILTDTGEQFWVFSIPDRAGFYLHGYFD